MKKIFLILVGLGSILVAGGLWWLYTQAPEVFSPEDRPLDEIQEIGVDRESLRASVLLDSPAGLQVLTVATGEVKPLAGSFEKLQDEVLTFSQSSQDTFWLLEAKERSTQDTSMQGLPPEDEGAVYNRYLVNWQQNQLQRLNETFEKYADFKNKELTSLIWAREGVLAVAFATVLDGSQTTPTQYALASLALDNFRFQDFGTVTASNLQLLSGDETGSTLFAKVTGENADSIIGKRFNSTQTTTVISDDASYLDSRHAPPGVAARFQGTTVELLQLSDQQVKLSIAPTSGYQLEPTIWWSASGEVFAVVEYQASDIDTKQVTFYTKDGTSLYTVPTTGSVVVTLAVDGKTAVIASNQAILTNEPAVDATPVVYEYIDVYAGTTQAISNILLDSTILGVL